MSQTREFIVNIEDQERDGHLLRFDSELSAPNPVFVWGDGEVIAVRPVRPSSSGVRPWDDAYASGMEVRVAVGDGHETPTSGTFTLTVENTSTSATATTDELTWPPTADNIRVAIAGANEGLGLFAVTVEASGSDYIITSPDPGFSLQGSDNELVPECEITATCLRAATSERSATWRLRINQVGLAYCEPSTTYAAASGVVTSVQTGTSTLASIQRITLSPAPYAGTWTLAFSRKQAVKAQAKANTATAEVIEVQSVADSGGDLGGKYFDIYDGSGLVRVWIDVANASTAPGDGGGRLIEVDISSDATASAVASAIKTAVDADADFAATVSDDMVTITNSVAGARSMPSVGTSGFAAARTIAGSYGTMHKKWFKVFDSNGSVGVWLNCGETGATPPTGAAACARAIEVSVTAGTQTASTVAANVASALESDSEFTASSASQVITITQATAGERDEPADGDTAWSIEQTSSGVAVSATLPYNASSSDIEEALDEEFSARLVSAGVYELTCAELGAQDLVTIGVSNLTAPKGLSGTLSVDTIAMQKAFEGVTADFIETKLSVEIQFAGEQPKTVLLIPCKVYKDVISTTSGVPFVVGAGAQKATVAITAGAESVTWTFTNAFDSAPSQVIAGPIRKNAPSDATPPFIVCENERSATAVTLNLSAPAPANCKVDIIAIP